MIVVQAEGGGGANYCRLHVGLYMHIIIFIFFPSSLFYLLESPLAGAAFFYSLPLSLKKEKKSSYLFYTC
jgi:hypothetical protein